MKSLTNYEDPPSIPLQEDPIAACDPESCSKIRLYDPEKLSESRPWMYIVHWENGQMRAKESRKRRLARLSEQLLE